MSELRLNDPPPPAPGAPLQSYTPLPGASDGKGFGPLGARNPDPDMMRMAMLLGVIAVGVIILIFRNL